MTRFCWVVVWWSLVSHSVFAADGQLDPAFGAGGKVTMDHVDAAAALTVAPDGRIYLAGSTVDEEYEGFVLGVIRLLPNGTPDTAYGEGGKATFYLTQSSEIADAALQPNGQLVFATFDNCGNCDVRQQVCRVTATGSGLDANFGDPSTPGCRVLRTDDELSIYALVVQADGKIVLAGEKNDHAWVFRLDAQGDPDAQFGSNGEVVFPWFQGRLAAVALASDGKIVLAGLFLDDINFEVFRLLPDGSPDLDFATGGRQSVIFDGSAYAFAVQVLADNSIVIAGQKQYAADFYPAIAKLGADGAPDPSFGDQGKIVWNPCGFVTGCSFVVRDMVVQSDDKIVIAGSRAYEAGHHTSDFFAMRMHPDGMPDASFGIGEGIPGGDAYVAFDLSKKNCRILPCG